MSDEAKDVESGAPFHSPIRVLSPGPTPNTFCAPNGHILAAPEGWALLPPGDAALTRRVKQAGEHWVVQEKVRRKVFARGVWAPTATIERIRAELNAERATEGYAKKRAASTLRRQKAEAKYRHEFRDAVLTFLAFHPTHTELAHRLAQAVTDHATPVGSGTVARTQRIPVDRRAKSAVIAWMRHQTTEYDRLNIARLKGERAELRRMFAKESHQLLDRYRRGEPIPGECPLRRALKNLPERSAP
jgi:hypothetical protein